MRYVDIDEIELPTGWRTRAKNAAMEVEKGKDPNDYGHIWRELKDNLAVLLNDKCWYCESIIDRSDNAVDHFRPKNRVVIQTRLITVIGGLRLTIKTIAMRVLTVIAITVLTEIAQEAERQIAFLCWMKQIVAIHLAHYGKKSLYYLILVCQMIGGY